MELLEQEEAYLLAWLAAMEAAGRPESELFVEHLSGKPTLAQQRRLAAARSNDHAKMVFSLGHPGAEATRSFTRRLVQQESHEQAWIAVQRELPQAERVGWRLGRVEWSLPPVALGEADQNVQRSGLLVLLTDGEFRALDGYGYLTAAADWQLVWRRSALPRMRALAAARGLDVAP
ncbi:hypothetical protein DSM112329_05097 [Paraconexibacter sp. AEG42_29]|uniref:Uncharacterized protein n=1 Tax=Paraconexibacter sp. AEG42_29 TaxID=2997339 RepID=A0AAU7B2P4_9ACTN